MINLYSWQKHPNFGDMLSVIVVEWLSGEPVRHVGENEARKLLAVGSVLQYAQNGDTVWGTGMHPTCQISFGREKSKLDLNVLAVRGPLSRDALLARGIACPEIYGDPAILMPLIVPNYNKQRSGVVLIPHMAEFHAVKKELNGRELTIVDPSGPWRNTLDKILSAELVISGSLHGLIVADAYGIPAIWYRAQHDEGMTKYLDYYMGTGRLPKPYYSLDDALKGEPTPVIDLSFMQKQLIAAFLNGRVKESSKE